MKIYPLIIPILILLIVIFSSSQIQTDDPEKITMLSTTLGTIILIGALITHTKIIKKKLKKHVLRSDEVSKYMEER